VFEYDVTIKAAGGPCAVAQTYLLMHAIERAVWKAITWEAENQNAIDTATMSVPPATSVSMLCVCLGDHCASDCYTNFVYPAPYPYIAAADVLRPVVDPEASVPPQCGCDFSYAGYDYDIGTCRSGWMHASALTKVQLSPSVYYYQNSKGEGMWHGVNFGREIHTERSLNETVELCRADETCNVLIYERKDKYWLAPGICRRASKRIIGTALLIISRIGRIHSSQTIPLLMP